MPAPTTANELLELVRKSGLIDDPQLREFVEKLRSSQKVPRLPTELAHEFVMYGVLTRFQADLLLKGKYKGFRMGDYRVLQPVGTGGMASIYLCEHSVDGSRVAVKVLPRERAENLEIRKRFEREGRAICNLHHPNIARAYDTGVDDKRYFLIMEYIDGWNLVEYLQEYGRPELGKACEFIRQAAVGLEHIHGMGLVHRDIKPANLLVSRSGVVKIVDMGLARVFADDREALTGTRSVIGTADYIAPEQTYDSHEVDIRADIYSLGMTLYFTLTGCTPFGDAPIDEKLLSHRSKQPTPIPAMRPEVPPPLVAVFEKMTAKDPNRRYPTPGDVVRGLEPWRVG